MRLSELIERADDEEIMYGDIEVAIRVRQPVPVSEETTSVLCEVVDCTTTEHSHVSPFSHEQRSPIRRFFVLEQGDEL